VEDNCKLVNDCTVEVDYKMKNNNKVKDDCNEEGDYKVNINVEEANKVEDACKVRESARRRML